VDEAPTMIRTPASACSGALRLGWVRRSIRDLALLVAGFPWGSGEVLVKRHWSTRSHTQCVPQSRPDIDHLVRHLLEQTSRRRGEKE
jgi:hypothetical protein